MNTVAQFMGNGRGDTKTQVAGIPAVPRKKEILIVYLKNLYTEAVRRVGKYFNVILVEEKERREN